MWKFSHHWSLNFQTSGGWEYKFGAFTDGSSEPTCFHDNKDLGQKSSDLPGGSAQALIPRIPTACRASPAHVTQAPSQVVLRESKLHLLILNTGAADAGETSIPHLWLPNSLW